MLRTLGWVDYLLWLLLLVVSLGIGVYFGFFEGCKRKKKLDKSETTEFLLGGRQMHAIPVACSLMASFFSAITLLGILVIIVRGINFSQAPLMKYTNTESFIGS